MSDNSQPLIVFNKQKLLDRGAQIDDEIAKVNKELYEKNLELAIKNHTLLIIRKMYEIMNTVYGVNETAVKLAEAIVKELKVHKIYIFLKVPEKNSIQFVSVYPDEFSKDEYIQYFNRPDYKINISLTNKDNFCVDCVLNKRTRLTNSAYDVLTPFVDEKK